MLSNEFHYIYILVILNQPLPGEIPSLAFIRSFYIREWVRYLHSKLDDSTKIDNFGFDPEPDLSSEFKRNWIYGKNKCKIKKKIQNNLRPGLDTN